MILAMLRWWYGTGWMGALQRIGVWTKGVERNFSLSLLLRTLFSPWRRIVSFSGRSFDARVRASLDNLVSRCVGFVVRFFVIIAALLAMVVALLGAVILVVVWPLLPLAFVYFVVRSITG